MQVELIHQRLGINPLYKEINTALSDDRFKTFRALVAYVSWQGIGLIHEQLEAFYDRGNKVSMILGVGDNRGEIDVLRYLKQRFPLASFSVFHAPDQNYTFHPKVYIFSNQSNSLVLLGSNNLTSGGLFGNTECSIKLSIENSVDLVVHRGINELWKEYLDPKPPFSKRNLRTIGKKLFVLYEKREKSYKAERPKMKDALDAIFPKLKLPFSPQTSFLKPQSKQYSKKGATLLLQILKETGAGGTQVQIPREVILKYFNVSAAGQQTIEVKVADGAIRPAVICHFGNNTHRISFPEITKMKRPFLMKFLRKGRVYFIYFVVGQKYRDMVTRCKNQTRYSAKKWEFF